MSLYLVTGGCGFIGSHLVEALLLHGARVRVLDDLSTGSRANLAPGAELVEGTVEDPDTLRAAMAGTAGVFHLAAIASVERGVREWWSTHRVNLSATVGVFDAARLLGPIPVVYASSAAVYGEQERLPIAETAPTVPLSAYGADKLGGELHARVAGHVHGVPTMGLRFFNVFGPRQDPASPYSGVISIFCERLVKAQPVTIFGDGGQTRDFIHVGDVVSGLVAAMTAASVTAPVLNLCSGRATSVRDLAGLIRELCRSSTPMPAPRYGQARSGEIRHSVGDPALSRALLGLGPPLPLREGLAEVIAWVRAGKPALADKPAPNGAARA